MTITGTDATIPTVPITPPTVAVPAASVGAKLDAAIAGLHQLDAKEKAEATTVLNAIVGAGSTVKVSAHLAARLQRLGVWIGAASAALLALTHANPSVEAGAITTGAGALAWVATELGLVKAG